MAAEGGVVRKSAGIGDFRDPQGGGGEKLFGHQKAVADQILLRGDVQLPFEQAIQPGAVHACAPGHVFDGDIVGIIMADIVQGRFRQLSGSRDELTGQEESSEKKR